MPATSSCASTPPAGTRNKLADLRTTITEVLTGLGMLGVDDIENALAARPETMTNVAPEVWGDLQRAWKEGHQRDVFTASFMNGRAFLEADDALRGRVPQLIEWKGAHRAPGDEVVPADLRVDHVYLVSCKYLSRIVVNASPHHLFDRLLAGGHGRRGNDWFREVAAAEHDDLFVSVRRAVDPRLPSDVTALDARQRHVLAHTLRGDWPAGAVDDYRALVDRTAYESARRWRTASDGNTEAMLWRLLRVGSAPYFVLGASPRGFVRLRIATPWDWRQAFELRGFEIEPRAAGQPLVSWRADVRRRSDGADLGVDGHVEVRWSHGRFGGPPEAKVYLDTPATQVPGYFPLQ
jgi:hypothetical protein